MGISVIAREQTPMPCFYRPAQSKRRCLSCVVWQFSVTWRPQRPSVRTVRDGHLDFHTAPERLCGLTHATHVDDMELNVLGCRVDILGTNCDQCVCMVQCCFTSTETIRLRTELCSTRACSEGLDHTPSIAFRHLPLWKKDVINQCLEFGIWPVHPLEKFAFINNL